MAKCLPPRLLELVGKRGGEAVRAGFDNEAEQDDGKRVAEALEIGVRTHRVDSAAVGTAVAFYPGRFLERLEIAEHKAVPPEAITSARRASGWLLPGIAPAELVKLLYINSGV